MSSRRWIAAGTLALAATVACSGRESAAKVPLGQLATDSAAAAKQPAMPISASARVPLDSGNALFRAKKYPAALAQYRLAAARAPEHAAPLFGIYMVARASGNVALADSALAGIRVRNPATPSVPHTLGDSEIKKIHKGVKNMPRSG